MKIGSYKKKIDFSSFDVLKFPFSIWNPTAYAHAGCGYHALASVTGIESPYSIRKKNKDKDSCNDWFIKKYLKSAGIKYQEITQCLLTNHRQDYIPSKIQESNIILASQLVKKNEMSWFLYGFGYCIHNQTIEPVKNLSFLNWPVDTAYLLFKDSWRKTK